MITTHQIISPTWVWLLTNERNRGIKELFGKDAETFIAGLPKEETTQNEPEQ